MSCYFRSDNYELIRGRTYDLSEMPISYLTANPQVYHYNSNFYTFLGRQRLDTLGDGTARAYVAQLKQNKTYRISPTIHTARVPNAENYHSTNIGIVDNNGNIYSVYTRQDNSYEMVKSDNAEDVSNFTTLAEEIGSGNQYGNIFRNPNDGGFHLLCKDGTQGVQFYDASSGFESWGSANALSTIVADYHYHRAILDNDFGGKNHINIQRRVGNDYKDNWYIYTTDWVTFRNIDNSWSKDVITNGALTQAELQANFATKDTVTTASFDNQFIDVTTGYPIFITGGGFHVNYYDGNDWQFDVINLGSKISNLDIIQSPHNYGNGIRFFAIVSDTSLPANNFRADMYYTDDMFTTVELLEEKFFYTQEGVRYIKLPQNFNSVSSGHNFPVVASTLKAKHLDDSSSFYQQNALIKWLVK